MTYKDNPSGTRKGSKNYDHTCHCPGGTLQVPPAMWGCRRHWFTLPATLRQKIWSEYQPGQETIGRPSKEYIEVAKEVQDWIKNNQLAHIEGKQ